MRYRLKMFSFVVFGLIALTVVIANTLYTFLHFDPQKPQDLGWSISMAGIYLGVFKYFLPSKSDAAFASGSSMGGNSRPPSPERVGMVTTHPNMHLDV